MYFFAPEMKRTEFAIDKLEQFFALAAIPLLDVAMEASEPKLQMIH